MSRWHSDITYGAGNDPAPIRDADPHAPTRDDALYVDVAHHNDIPGLTRLCVNDTSVVLDLDHIRSIRDALDSIIATAAITALADQHDGAPVTVPVGSELAVRWANGTNTFLTVTSSGPDGFTIHRP